MATDANSHVDRRGFLKGAAAGAAGAAALTVPGVAPIDANAQAPQPARPAPVTPEQAARNLAAETAPLPDEVDVQTVDNPGSDFMGRIELAELTPKSLHYKAIQSWK